MNIIQPPASVDSDVSDFLNRLQQNVSRAIADLNDTSFITVFPERPREGRIYYLNAGSTSGSYRGQPFSDEHSSAKKVYRSATREAPDLETGFYVFVDGAWERLDRGETPPYELPAVLGRKWNNV